MAITLSRLSLNLYLKLRLQHILLARAPSCVLSSGFHSSRVRTTDDIQDGRPGSGKRSLKARLHNRVLTDVDWEHEQTHLKNIPVEDDADSFGRLERTEHGSRRDRVMTDEEHAKERAHVFQNVTSTESDTFGHLGRGKHFSRLKFGNSTTRDRGGESMATGEADSGGQFGAFKDLSKSSQRFERGSRPRRRFSAEADVFGTLSGDDSCVGAESLTSEIGSHNERFPDDDKPEKSHIRLDVKDRRHDPYWYEQKIEQFGKEGKIKEAIAVLEEWMLINDRVMPSKYTFTLLIGVLGRVGYTKKAFQLFNTMKKMGIHPGDPTYTALFNACSNSPWRADALSRAHNLRELMVAKGFEPNLLTYNAMIKTYGMFGDIKTAFMLMDELVAKYQPTAETFSFLLMACISDQKAGFKHAVEVWRLLQEFRLKPDLPLYNLLLRAVRDCGAGDADFANTLLQAPPQVKQLSGPSTHQEADPHIQTLDYIADTTNRDFHHQQLSSQSGRTDISLSNTESRSQCSDQSPVAVGEDEWWQSDPVQVSNQFDNLPNLLDVGSNLSRIISLGDLGKPDGRLAVIGGAAGVLKAMKQDRVRPNVSTFSQLIEVGPPTVEAETALLGAMEVFEVKPDIVLYNSIIHRRSRRKDLEAARDVLKMISVSHLHPDMKTFGCLAMTCNRRKDGLQLLKDVENAGMSPNIEVMGTLSFASKLDFGYKLAILQEVEKLGLSPNNKFIEGVEFHIALAKRRIVEAEKGLTENTYIMSGYFQSTFKEFMVCYKRWLKTTQPQKTAHPWQDFMKKKEENIEKAEVE